MGINFKQVEGGVVFDIYFPSKNCIEVAQNECVLTKFLFFVLLLLLLLLLLLFCFGALIFFLKGNGQLDIL